MTSIPSAKLCECGCGEPTPIARQTRARYGHVKGQPVRFRAGHQFRGRRLGNTSGSKPEPIEPRFWTKVDKGPHPNGCWLWVGSRNNKGYGLFSVMGKVLLAHRVSYELAYGPIAHGFDVLHECDTPPCVHPAHLHEGTHRQNMREASERGLMHFGERNGSRTWPDRIPRGEAKPQTKLTESQVREMRCLHQQGFGYKRLSKMFGVSFSAAHAVVNRRTWKHVP